MPKLWNYRETRNSSSATIVPPRLEQHIESSRSLPIMPQMDSRRRHKSPSKKLRDITRGIRRNRVFQARRQEQLRLWGYIRLRTGEILTIDETLRRLRDALSPNPNRRRYGIEKKDIAEWHQPETFHDVLNSLGEIDALQEYPALGIEPGTVLVDPKIRHRDPALER